MLEFMFVGVGGFIGSCLRFGVTKLAHVWCLTFPFGTLISNVVAGLAIGFIIGLEQQSVTVSPKAHSFLTAGLLGGLSTFSAFSLETVNLFENGKYFLASCNILLNLVLSLLGVVVGMAVAKRLVKG